MTHQRTLRTGFLRSAERFPDRPALEVRGGTTTYGALRDRAASIAATLAAHAPSDGPDVTAVLVYRSETAFAAVLGVLLRGHGYVPLNPNYPADRTRTMLTRSGSRALVVDEAGESHLADALEGVDESLLVVIADSEDTAELAARFPKHRFLGRRDLAPASEYREGPTIPDAIAYLLFTSGSTGQPKGVMLAHRNVTSFVDAMVERFGFDEGDRFSQMPEMTFDMSVTDMFVAWEVGAVVCCPSRDQCVMPYGFIRESKVTVWNSVPSVAIQMKKLNMLEPGFYPSIRASMFAGEALPVPTAEAWALACPNTVLDCQYGPTETTITCSAHRFDAATSPGISERGILPIGLPYAGTEYLVVDEEDREVAPGEAGELLIAGPQVALGYYRDPERTAKSFLVPKGRTELHYRSGDRVRRPVGDDPYRFLARIDFQIKIRGYRVELGEIEAVLKEIARVEIAVVVGWPVTAGGADALVAFLGSTSADTSAIKAELKTRLPAFMVPTKIRLLADFPLNANGKVDRKALLALLGGT